MVKRRKIGNNAHKLPSYPDGVMLKGGRELKRRRQQGTCEILLGVEGGGGFDGLGDS